MKMTAGVDAATCFVRDVPGVNFKRSKEHVMEDVIEETLTQLDRARIDEEQLVLDWRIGQLERLGVSRLSALAFAARIDWHEIAALIKRGCSPELAVDIVR